MIGFTGDLGKKVIPNIVGVDIGCGMECVELGKVDLDFERLDKIIRKHIAFGKGVCREEKVWFCLEDLKAFSRIKTNSDCAAVSGLWEAGTTLSRLTPMMKGENIW